MICRLVYIYKITSPTGRTYVGKTVNPKARFNQYKNLHCKNQKLLIKSLSKHGFDAHKTEILQVVDANLSEYWEQYWIRACNSYKGFNNAGMNLTMGGEGAIGRKQSEATKKKISKIKLGSKLSQETKNKISAAGRLRKHSPETISKILKSRGKWYHTEEAKQKMSASKKGVPKSDEFKKKRRDYMLGRRIDCSLTPILDTETGVYYDAQKDAAWAHNIKYITFSWRVRNKANYRFIKV
jgi:group I intron endonuclease